MVALAFKYLTPWPPLLKEKGNRGQGVKGVRYGTLEPGTIYLY
jgi:hypothetical protein